MRDVVTTLLELVALLLLAAAAGVAVGQWALPAGLAAGGAVLLAASWLVSRR